MTQILFYRNLYCKTSKQLFLLSLLSENYQNRSTYHSLVIRIRGFSYNIITWIKKVWEALYPRALQKEPDGIQLPWRSMTSTMTQGDLLIALLPE